MILAVIRDADAELALGNLGHFARLQVTTIRFVQGLVASFGKHINDAFFAIAGTQVYAVILEEVIEGWFRESAFQWNQHRLIILISILVDHHQDLAKLGKDIKRLTTDQWRM